MILKIDLEAEVNIFLNFLNNREYPQHRNIIFFRFPELKTLLESNVANETVIVSDFLKEVRTKNKINIDKSTEFVAGEIEKYGEKMLEILASLMNYKWKSGAADYFLIPTIFPISPFNGNTFYYSIYESLNGVTEYPKVMAVSAHEISHIILFNILTMNKINLTQELLYFIKELIAPVLVYQDDFSGIFNKYIVGNYNVLEVYFEDGDRIVRAFDYFLEIFQSYRKDGKDFVDFLNKMILICQNIESEIKAKRSFDNQYGIQIMKDAELLKTFRRPIKLNYY